MYNYERSLYLDRLIEFIKCLAILKPDAFLNLFIRLLIFTTENCLTDLTAIHKTNSFLTTCSFLTGIPYVYDLLFIGSFSCPVITGCLLSGGGSVQSKQATHSTSERQNIAAKVDELLK